MNESFRLLESLDLDRLTTEQAIREIQRIADRTMNDMAPVYYVERMEAIAQLARLAAAKVNEAGGGG